MADDLLAADLFAGAGGLSLGFEMAGFKTVLANDLNEDAAQTYRANFPDVAFFDGSIEDLAPADVLDAVDLEAGEIDVLVGGPPCQGFSIHAPERDKSDARNHLYREYGRVALEGLQPKVVVMENVPGMLSLEDGHFVEAIYEMFWDAGYELDHMVLCAAHYGVPQERWRLFFIGTRTGAKTTFPFPTHTADVRANFTGGRRLTWLDALENGGPPQTHLPLADGGELRSHVSVRDAIDDLPELKINEGEEEQPYNGGPHSSYQKRMRRGANALFNHVAGRLAKINLKRLQHIPAGGNWTDIPRDLLPAGMKRANTSDHTKRYGRADPEGLSCTIMTKCDPHWGAFFHYQQDRALTVREAARLQSFPDRFRFYGSRMSQHEQVGNAVPPLLAEAVADHIKETLLR